VLSNTKNRVNSKGHLEIGGCDVVSLAQKYGTPLYVLDEAFLRKNMREYIDSFKLTETKFKVAYASKALCTMALCKIAEQEGLNLDVVSGGELYTAIKSNFPTERIHFHGNNKSIEEISMAIKNNIGLIVADNFFDMKTIENVAKNLNKKINVLLRITPGVEAHTHQYITTGQEDSKFGFDLSSGDAFVGVKLAKESQWLNFKGLHIHIGSQIFDMTGFKVAIERIFQFMLDIKQNLGILIEILNMGGGLGIRYTEDDTPITIREFVFNLVSMIKNNAKEYSYPMPELWVEPGRSIVGEAGYTLYTIGTKKEIPGVRNYLAIDGGMSDNIRPALYQAKYKAIIGNKANKEATDLYTVAGKACESGDILIKDILLPKADFEDILVVFSTGAYNYAMASNYNRIPRPAMILVNNGHSEIIVQRESYEDLIINDRIPESLTYEYKK